MEKARLRQEKMDIAANTAAPPKAHAAATKRSSATQTKVKQQQKKETLDKQEDEILARHGLKTCYDRKVYAKDVVDFLLHLEGRVDHE